MSMEMDRRRRRWGWTYNEGYMKGKPSGQDKTPGRKTCWGGGGGRGGGNLGLEGEGG